MDRRTFIKTGAAAAFAMAQDSSRDNHTPVRPLTAKGGAIDVHHHFRPPIPGAVGDPKWTPQMSLEAMDKFNIGRLCFRSLCSANSSMPAHPKPAL